MFQINASHVTMIKDWLDSKDDVFDCDCDGSIEYDTNAFIHGGNCSSEMETHCNIVLTRLIEWLQENGPINVKGW